MKRRTTLALSFCLLFGCLTERKSRKPPSREDFVRAALAVQERWEKGNDGERWISGALVCKGLLEKSGDAGREYLPCNPNFLVCYYRHFKEKVGGYAFRVNFPAGKRFPFKRVRTRHSVALLATLESAGVNMKIALADTCSEVFLPRGGYSYGPYSPHKKNWRWDNLDRDIFVDRFLVRRRDVWEWDGENLDPATFSGPATHLTLKQMQDHCARRGKQLMQSHIFDAAAFHPGNSRTPRVSVRGPLPWSRSMERPEEPTCERLQSAECPRSPSLGRPLAWTGMGQVLGGVMEVQRNPVEMKADLMPSSALYPHDSPVHQLGHRAHWAGGEKLYRHFNFKAHSPPGNPGDYPIGFRCMRVLP